MIRVEAATSLDRAYVRLDRSNTPFAVLQREEGVGVLDAHHLRRRVMGTFAEGPGC